MERINLTNTITKTIPLTIRNKDIDLTFDANNMLMASTIISMADELTEYQSKASTLNLSEDSKNPEEVRASIKAVRAFAQEGLDLCKHFNDTLAGLIPNWAETVEGIFINLQEWENLIFALARIVSEAKATRAVSEQMEAER